MQIMDINSVNEVQDVPPKGPNPCSNLFVKRPVTDTIICISSLARGASYFFTLQPKNVRYVCFYRR